MIRINPGVAAAVRSWANRHSAALTIYRRLRSFSPRASERSRLLSCASAFVPVYSGSSSVLASLTLQSIDQTFPLLADFIESTGRHNIEPIPASEFDRSQEGDLAASALAVLLDNYGSDKAKKHKYHLVYGAILANKHKFSLVLEIGLGSNNEDVPSNMGSEGRPGASLRAFRDFLPDAEIFGADVDFRILFEETRIRTFYVDQTDMETVIALGGKLPNDIDLIIDDGLHSPNANLATLILAMGKLRIGGWVVIEDISAAAVPVWQVVAALLPPRFRSVLVNASGAYMFTAQRLS